MALDIYVGERERESLWRKVLVGKVSFKDFKIQGAQRAAWSWLMEED